MPKPSPAPRAGPRASSRVPSLGGLVALTQKPLACPESPRGGALEHRCLPELRATGLHAALEAATWI